MKNKIWTKNDYDYLKNNWGYVSVPTIAKKLNRSANAVKIKAGKLKLGAFLDNSDLITFNQLFFAIYGRSQDSCTKEMWINNGFPIHKKRNDKCSFDMVDIDEFWKWAEKHSELIDFSQCHENSLGLEPEWVAQKRKYDEIKSINIKTTPWTKSEDELLSQYLKRFKYSYKDLEKMLMRSCGAIQRRILDLGLKERPLKADNHNKWSVEEFLLLGDMIKQRYTYEAMSEKLNRSTKAIRGRVFDYYLTEKLDNVRSMIGNGQFGDNLPDRPIRYMRVMTDENKLKTKMLLANLAFVIREKAKVDSNVSEEFIDYWQKDMCQNWSDIHGCLKNCTDCDSCTEFSKISPQGCVRCGSTFYERKQNKYCYNCRVARLKQARKKYVVLNRRQKI